MNRLFNDFFRKNGGLILGVFPTMGGDFGGVLHGNLKEMVRRKAKRGIQTDFKVPSSSLFNDQDAETYQNLLTDMLIYNFWFLCRPIGPIFWTIVHHIPGDLRQVSRQVCSQTGPKTIRNPPKKTIFFRGRRQIKQLVPNRAQTLLTGPPYLF